MNRLLLIFKLTSYFHNDELYGITKLSINREKIHRKVPHLQKSI